MEIDNLNEEDYKKLQQMVANLHPGQSVWTVDDCGLSVHEYVFLASCPRYPGSPDSALILSSMPLDLRTYEQLVDYHLHECAYNGETYMTVVAPEQIYLDENDAYAVIHDDEQ